MSASSLTGISNSQILQNVAPDPNVIYNPSIPVLKDVNIRNVRNLKFKDRYYIDNSINGQMKNTDSLTLGPNTKYVKQYMYNNMIDENYLRRLNSSNKKLTLVDHNNGSANAYYSIPVHIKTPQPNLSLSSSVPTSNYTVSNSTDEYQYTNRFKPDTTQPTESSVKTPSKYKPLFENITEDIEDSNLNSNISSDPTDDPAYIKMLADINKQKKQDLFDAELYRIPVKDYNKNGYKDAFGKPIIIPISTRNYDL